LLKDLANLIGSNSKITATVLKIVLVVVLVLVLDHPKRPRTTTSFEDEYEILILGATAKA
jgi:hypothetical protein